MSIANDVLEERALSGRHCFLTAVWLEIGDGASGKRQQSHTEPPIV